VWSWFVEIFIEHEIEAIWIQLHKYSNQAKLGRILYLTKTVKSNSEFEREYRQLSLYVGPCILL